MDERGVKPPDELDQSNAPGAAARQPVSLYERLREDEPRYEAENGWAVENNPYWPWVEPLTLDDVLPAEEATEPWQQLSATETLAAFVLRISTAIEAYGSRESPRPSPLGSC